MSQDRWQDTTTVMKAKRWRNHNVCEARRQITFLSGAERQIYILSRARRQNNALSGEGVKQHLQQSREEEQCPYQSRDTSKMSNLYKET